MPKIFLCYRREDSKWAAQTIYNDLVDHFGSEAVVFDIDTIPLGADFREYLHKEVSRCDIFLAVIGDQWLDMLKRRLDEPNDFVRIEIQAALEREIPVVPILIGEKSVPSEKDLPPELANLSYKQATEVRAGANLRSQLKRLVKGLDRLFSESKVGKEIKQKQVDKELTREESPKKYTNRIGMEFVLIPAGNFMMGSKLRPEEVVKIYGGKTKLFEMEHPQHKVTISKSFYLQSTQVTQAQWQKVMGNNPSRFKECGDDCPVENVSWNDAQDFIKRLNEKEKTDNYRLPTEAEWEYACRAGTANVFFFGDDTDELDDYAWYDQQPEDITNPVGKKKPNPWGLYDMYGNVGEWCQDWISDYPSNPVVDPRGPNNGEYRVLRGSSCWGYAWEQRSASRFGEHPELHHDGSSFRVARNF